ncbi:hypothetical protein ACQJBY_031024 [Aegilops geniculata]
MTGVLNALASYVTKMLADMATDEVAMLIGVSGQINDLSVKLRDLNNFLEDADRRHITDKSVCAWVEDLKRAMYLATDILDLCHLKVMERGSSKDMGCFNPLLFCLRNPLHAHDIGSRIKVLNQQLDDICKRGHSFNFMRLEGYQERKTNHPPPVDRKTHPVLELSGVVGEKIEDDTGAIVQLLTKEASHNSDGIKVFAIIGVGGIGKTTLSKKVFNDEAMQAKFSKRIWLSITQEFSDVELLRTAISAANGNLPGPGGGSQDKALLVPALVSTIKDKKFFLVLDDMWGVDEWNRLLMTPFSHGAPGSCVLATTRHEAVARGIRAMEPYHHVDKLGPDDAWSLLRKQILGNDRSEPAIDMLKDIGLQIVEKCDGLPLAIKVMGGLLCQKEKERLVWEKVLNDAIWSVSQMPEELNNAIYLSYEDLSPCLKQCFLHFSLKPKKTMFQDSEYVSMWIGEGFVHGDSDRLEELGIEYHTELVLRNLIEPDTSYAGSHFCNMHDVVRSFALFVSRNDSLVLSNGESTSNTFSIQRFLRLSIETKGVESDTFQLRSLQEQRSLRSIILIGNFKIQPGDSMTIFSSLRTLHMESTDCVALLGSLHQLKHLRYLAVKKCNGINSLPQDIHKMKLLQHLSFEDCGNLVSLPSSIVKLQELRYLDLDGTCVITMPRGFHALKKLRTIFGFPSHMDGDWCSLEEIGPLSQLRCIRLLGLQNVFAGSFARKARLGEKVYLSMLFLQCSSGFGDDGQKRENVTEKDQGVIEEVFDGLCPPPCIQDIRMQGYYGCQLPRWMRGTSTTLLKSLRILVLHDMACCTQLPDGLCQLPCLEHLEVGQAVAIKRVGPEFVQPYGHPHHPSSRVVVGFPRLNELVLDGLVEWEEWEWEEEVQAMPVLEDLLIQSCKLRCIPPGLASHARFLKKLTIYNVQGFQSVEDFASVVELNLSGLPDLTRISNFPKLRKLEIYCCGKVESLEEMDALQRLVLTVHYSESQLPSYLQTVQPSHLLLDCWPGILLSMALGESGSEWAKFSNIQNVEAYADVDGIEKRWHVFYTREPYNIETNIDLQEWSGDVNFLQSEGEDGLPRLAALMESADEDEEDADKPEKIEEESMGQGREE